MRTATFRWKGLLCFAALATELSAVAEPPLGVPVLAACGVVELLTWCAVAGSGRSHHF